MDERVEIYLAPLRPPLDRAFTIAAFACLTVAGIAAPFILLFLFPALAPLMAPFVAWPGEVGLYSDGWDALAFFLLMQWVGWISAALGVILLSVRARRRRG